MLEPPFAHLHVHSPFSFRRGQFYRVFGGASGSVGATGAGSPTIITYRGSAVCPRLGLVIKPILGAEVTTVGGYHLVLLARDEGGYRNLCRLLSRAHLREGGESRRLRGRTWRPIVRACGGAVQLSPGRNTGAYFKDVYWRLRRPPEGCRLCSAPIFI